MAAEYRNVAIAAGHQVRVRRSVQQATRSGYVRVEKSHRAPFEIPEQLWNAAGLPATTRLSAPVPGRA